MSSVATSARYDRVALTQPNGDVLQMSPAEFQALPLDQRVKAVIQGKARFFQGTQVVSSRDALRSY